mmetsp:Transcript_12879/g.32903  ORF Transcript_12879/g.32903 Transcript_12879/m.32903 type:complete len:260 (-) Transcript_12879:698-1477(-)
MLGPAGPSMEEVLEMLHQHNHACHAHGAPAQTRRATHNRRCADLTCQLRAKGPIYNTRCTGRALWHEYGRYHLEEHSRQAIYVTPNLPLKVFSQRLNVVRLFVDLRPSQLHHEIMREMRSVPVGHPEPVQGRLGEELVELHRGEHGRNTREPRAHMSCSAVVRHSHDFVLVFHRAVVDHNDIQRRSIVGHYGGLVHKGASAALDHHGDLQAAPSLPHAELLHQADGLVDRRGIPQRRTSLRRVRPDQKETGVQERGAAR